MRLLFLALVLLPVVSSDLPAPYSDYCILDSNQNLYDPKDAGKVKWFTVNLDDPPEEHFKEIATAYKKQINDLLQSIKDLISPWFPELIKIIDVLFEDLMNWIPEPYNSEVILDILRSNCLNLRFGALRTLLACRWEKLF